MIPILAAMMVFTRSNSGGVDSLPLAVKYTLVGIFGLMFVISIAIAIADTISPPPPRNWKKRKKKKYY